MASISHVGLFPWCVDPSTSFFETEAAVKESAVPMWWRVKVWTFDVVFELKYITVPPQFFTFTDSVVYSIPDTQKISPTNQNFVQNETDLVCAGVVYDQESGIQNRTTYDWTFYDVDGFGGSNELGLNTLKIGPNFFFEAYNDDTRGVTTSEGATVVGNLNVEFCGVSFACPLYQAFEAEALVNVTSFEGTLRATEYWGYDPNDGGGPIYDTATGVRIRDDV